MLQLLFLLFKDISDLILDEVLSQSELYAKCHPSDITNLPKINVHNFVNICNFVDYYQLINDAEFIINIQYHILCQTKEVIDNMHLIPLNIRQKVHQNSCLTEMKCINNNIKHVACYEFLIQKYNISYDIDDASRYGYLEIVKYLFEVAHQDCTVFAIDNASCNGHLELVKYLLEVRHKDCTQRAMILASRNGHLELVKYLFEVACIKYTKWPTNWASERFTKWAINWASENGHLETVKYLFEVVHIDCTEYALYSASGNGHFEIVKYLVEVRRKDVTIDVLELAKSGSYSNIVKYLTEVYDKKRLRQNSFI